MGYGEFTRAAGRPSASAAGRWRSHDGPSPPTRDGSGNTLKQHLWGAPEPAAMHIGVDDLVQIAVNDDLPSQPPLRRAGPADANEADCESFYYPMQNANFNLLGLSDANGTLVERYEYTPGVYPPGRGQRTVYKKAGIDDELTTAPLVHSQRVETDAGRAPYGLCDVGHQGLMHEREFGLIRTRLRYAGPYMALMQQRDPNGYGDGMQLYLVSKGSPLRYTDPTGKFVLAVGLGGTVQLGIGGQAALQFTMDATLCYGGVATVNLGVRIPVAAAGVVWTVYPTMGSICSLNGLSAAVGGSIDLGVSVGVEGVLSGPFLGGGRRYPGIEVTFPAIGVSPIAWEIHAYPIGAAWLFASSCNCGAGVSVARASGMFVNALPGGGLLRTWVARRLVLSRKMRPVLQAIQGLGSQGLEGSLGFLNGVLWRRHRRPYPKPRCRAFLAFEDMKPGTTWRPRWIYEDH